MLARQDAGMAARHRRFFQRRAAVHGSVRLWRGKEDLVASSDTTISIPELRDTFNGRVIAPDDLDYDEARTVISGSIDRRPAVIIRTVDSTDVSRVVQLARETGLELAVRSGGH